MLYLKTKDKKNRKKFYKLEFRFIINKFSFLNRIQQYSYDSNIRRLIIFKYLKKRSLDMRIRNRIIRRCILTNRTRATFQKFNISRIVLRDLMSFGIIPGYKKAVW
jgi:ribosomal protein S14